MRPIPPKATRITLAALLAVLASLACALPQLPGPQNNPGAAPAPAPEGSAASAQATPAAADSPDEILQPDPLDHLLALHSVQVNLDISRPDGTGRSIQVFKIFF